MITICSQHGESTHGRKARCSVSRQVRGAFKRYTRKHPDRAEGLIMCCVMNDEPDHAAVCGSDQGGIHRLVHGKDSDARWRAELLRCLKSTVRGSKIRRTKAAKKKAAARRKESA